MYYFPLHHLINICEIKKKKIPLCSLEISKRLQAPRLHGGQGTGIGHNGGTQRSVAAAALLVRNTHAYTYILYDRNNESETDHSLDKTNTK